MNITAAELQAAITDLIENTSDEELQKMIADHSPVDPLLAYEMTDLFEADFQEVFVRSRFCVEPVSQNVFEKELAAFLDFEVLPCDYEDLALAA